MISTDWQQWLAPILIVNTWAVWTLLDMNVTCTIIYFSKLVGLFIEYQRTIYIYGLAGLIVLFWRHCASPDWGGEERCWACCCNKSSWYRGLGPLFGGKHSLWTTHLGLHKFSLFRLQKYTFLLLCWGHIFCQWSSWLNKCYDICNIMLSGTVWLEMKK